jgi:uncharacterized membrane protein
VNGIAPIVLFVCFGALGAYAQRVEVPLDNPTATTATVWLVAVRGIIADPTSAVMPNATLVLQARTRAGFRDVQSTKSDQIGRFDFGEKPPGLYRLIASARGFCRIPVEVSRAGWARLKILLPGGATDTSPGYCHGKAKVEKLDE